MPCADKTCREEQPEAFKQTLFSCACSCLYVCVLARALRMANCHRVMKQPKPRTLFILTEEILPRPRCSHTVNKDTTRRLSQTGSGRSLESQNKRSSQELIKDSAHVRLGSRCKSEVNSSSQQCVSDRAKFLTCNFPDGCNLTTWCSFFMINSN